MAFADPRAFITFLQLERTAHVADFGAGSGAFTLALAHYLTGGLVYAIDIQKDLLDRLKNEALKQHRTNITYLWGDLETRGGSKLTDNSVDCVLIANMLFQSAVPYSILLEAKRILKPRGKLAVVEWKDSFSGLGPQSSSVVTPDTLRTLFDQAGFRVEAIHDLGDHHYGMIGTNA